MRRVLIASLVVLILPAFWLVSELGASWYLHRSLSEGWPTRTGALSDVVRSLHDHPKNETAARLEVIAAGLGVDLVPHADRSSSRVPRIDTAPWKAIQQPVEDYIQQTVAASSRHPAPAPPAFAAYLAQRSTSFSALVDQLENGVAPSWEVRSSAGFKAPIPNLLGHMTLVRILVTAALNSASSGDDALAWRDVHAAAVLTAPLFDRPDLISMLVGFAEANMIVGGMRQLDGAPEWSLDWPRQNLQAALTRTAVVEAWPVYELFTRPLSTDLFAVFTEEHQPTFDGRLLSVTARPYLTASAANAAVVHRRSLQAYSSVAPCDQHVVGVTSKAVPRWNLVGRVTFLELGGSYQRLERLLAHIEGTRLLLSARHQKALTNAWPATAPTFQPTCRPPLWRYEVRGSQIYIRAQHPISVPTIKGAVTLSQEFTER